MENIKTNQIKFYQVKNQNFYTAHTKNGIILKSYNTIVGYLDINTLTAYRVRYTHTTGKQLTQFLNNYKGIDILEKYTTAEKLHDIIKTAEHLDINTEYNGAIVL